MVGMDVGLKEKHPCNPHGCFLFYGHRFRQEPPMQNAPFGAFCMDGRWFLLLKQVAVCIAQNVFLYLAHDVAGQSVDQHAVLGHFEIGHL